MNCEERPIYKDVNLLELMIIVIDHYFNNCFFIGDVIDHLESYLNQLETIDEEWKVEFRTEWSDVEVAYSLILYENDGNLDFSDKERFLIIENSLKNLKIMIEEKLNQIKSNN